MRIKTFESFQKPLTNKFDFQEGKVYQYHELPKQIQEDIDVQLEDGEYNSDDYNYVAQLLEPSQIEEYLHNVFGEYSIGEAIDHPDMKRLIKKIKRDGLDYPPVGNEGNHRALAFYELGLPLPYLNMELKEEWEETNEMMEDKYDYDRIAEILKKTQGWGNGALAQAEDFENSPEYFQNPQDESEYAQQFHVYLTDLGAGGLRGGIQNKHNLRLGKWRLGVQVNRPVNWYSKLT
jgi:hypothetical protein